MIDLEKEMDVRAVQINLTDHDLTGLMGIPYNHFSVQPPEKQLIRHRWLLEGSNDGKTWETLCDKREAQSDMTHDLIVFEDGKTVRYIKLTSFETPYYGNFALMGLRIFGHDDVEKPEAVTSVVADRCKDDPCSVTFKWDKSEGAVGYNVCWGIAEDKLYHSSLVYSDTELVLHS
jgi:hypothetical protein